MNKNYYCLALIFFISILFTNCSEDEIVNTETSGDSSSAARKGSGPVANAGQDVMLVLPSNSTVLDGSGSKLSAGTTATYQWSKVTGPDSFTFSDPKAKMTSVSTLVEGTYTMRLTVLDSKNRKSEDDVVVTVNKNLTTTTPSTDEFYFQGNMDAVTISTSSGKLIFNGWDQLKNHAYVENFEINNVGGTSYAYQKIQADPLYAERKALYAAILDDDPAKSGTTRAQMSLRFKDEVNLPVYHTSQRMYLNPDIGYLEKYSSSITWFTLVEIWNKRVAEWDGSESGSARWGLAIHKDSGDGKTLYWRLKSDYMQPETLHDTRMWTYYNKTVPIPLGKWFTLDVYMKRGESSNGRMVVKITPDGGQTQVLFDVANSTIYPGHPEIPVKSWQSFKLYTNDVYLDWMRSNGKVVSAYYNDFKWYKN